MNSQLLENTLPSPKDIINQYPTSKETQNFINKSRNEIKNIVKRQDKRLLVVVGPCSIHDSNEAYEYAVKLSKEQVNLPNLKLVMRTYFEKPRTNVGWKGFLSDPFLNNTNNLEVGLIKARELLLKVNELGLATSSEILDPILHKYIEDLMSWGAIGARTTESQIHRVISSNLDYPVGFKNGTQGSIKVAQDAILASRKAHTFPDINNNSQLVVRESSGNNYTHLVLRGGNLGPNYYSKDVIEAYNSSNELGINPYIMIDLSHANSEGDYLNQLKVSQDIISQLKNNNPIMGIMVESNINPGKQPLKPPLKKGVSITDGCINIDDTIKMLREINSSI
ncbi:MAG: 3-deoxy-7-phosphoheptulonate synthase [Psittacicella sp.]